MWQEPWATFNSLCFLGAQWHTYVEVSWEMRQSVAAQWGPGRGGGRQGLWGKNPLGDEPGPWLPLERRWGSVGGDSSHPEQQRHKGLELTLPKHESLPQAWALKGLSHLCRYPQGFPQTVHVFMGCDLQCCVSCSAWFPTPWSSWWNLLRLSNTAWLLRPEPLLQHTTTCNGSVVLQVKWWSGRFKDQGKARQNLKCFVTGLLAQDLKIVMCLAHGKHTKF